MQHRFLPTLSVGSELEHNTLVARIEPASQQRAGLVLQQRSKRRAAIGAIVALTEAVEDRFLPFPGVEGKPEHHAFVRTAALRCVAEDVARAVYQQIAQRLGSIRAAG